MGSVSLVSGNLSVLGGAGGSGEGGVTGADGDNGGNGGIASVFINDNLSLSVSSQASTLRVTGGKGGFERQQRLRWDRGIGG